MPPMRRRSPGWIRQSATLHLHRLGGKLLNDQRSSDWSDGQERLWLCLVSELEYRNRRRAPGQRCTCQLCWGPFDVWD